MFHVHSAYRWYLARNKQYIFAATWPCAITVWCTLWPSAGCASRQVQNTLELTECILEPGHSPRPAQCSWHKQSWCDSFWWTDSCNVRDLVFFSGANTLRHTVSAEIAPQIMDWMDVKTVPEWSGPTHWPTTTLAMTVLLKQLILQVLSLFIIYYGIHICYIFVTYLLYETDYVSYKINRYVHQ